MSWTDERVEEAKQLWNQGLSASQIAAKIGGLTRNAVLAKLWRAGLTRPGYTRREPAKRITRRRSTLPALPSPSGPATAFARRQPRREPDLDDEPMFDVDPVVPHGEEVDVPLLERKGVADLEADDCRWPINDPRHADFHFCNRKKVAGLPYCEHHARRAYQPVSTKPRAATYATTHQTERDLVDA